MSLPIAPLLAALAATLAVPRTPDPTAPLWAEVGRWEAEVASGSGGPCAHRSLVDGLVRAFDAEIERAEGLARAESAARWRLEREETLRAALATWHRLVPEDPAPLLASLALLATLEEHRQGLRELAARFPDDLEVFDARIRLLVASRDHAGFLATSRAFLAHHEGLPDLRTVLNQAPDDWPETLSLVRESQARFPDELFLVVREGHVRAALGQAPEVATIFARLEGSSTGDFLLAGASGLPALCREREGGAGVDAIACLTRLLALVESHEPPPPEDPWAPHFADLERRTRHDLATLLALGEGLAAALALGGADDPDFALDVAYTLEQRGRCPAAVEFLAAGDPGRVSEDATSLGLLAAVGCLEQGGGAWLGRWLPALPDRVLAHFEVTRLPSPYFELVWDEMGRRTALEVVSLRARSAPEAQRQGRLAATAAATTRERWSELAPQDPGPWWLGLRAAVESHDFAAALAAFEEASRRATPGDEQPWAEALGLAQEALRTRPDLARRAAERALAFATSWTQEASAQDYLALAARALGEEDVALEHSRRAAELRRTGELADGAAPLVPGDPGAPYWNFD